MSLDGLLDINRWVRPWETLLASANLGDVQTLGTPDALSQIRQGMFTEFHRARRQSQYLRLGLGPDRWSEWAAGMLAQDRGLRGSRREAIWNALAHVDLSSETIPYELDFDGLTFPGAFSLTQARLGGYVTATGATVHGVLHLAGARFAADAAIDRCNFHGSVQGHDSEWLGRIEARGTVYHDEVRLCGAKFDKDVWFSNGDFRKLADFTGARFASDAGFGSARFGGDACFDGVAFDDTLGMEGCRFSTTLSFRRAYFGKRLFFNNAAFAEEPMIDGAHFTFPPLLKGASFPDAPQASDLSPLLRTIAAEG